MSTQAHTLATDSATDLTDELSMIDGSTYIVQVLGPGPVFLSEVLNSADDPEPGDAAHILTLRETWTVIQESDSSFWAWGYGAVAVTEANS